MQPVEAERGSGNIPEQGPRSVRLSSPLCLTRSVAQAVLLSAPVGLTPWREPSSNLTKACGG